MMMMMMSESKKGSMMFAEKKMMVGEKDHMQFKPPKKITIQYGTTVTIDPTVHVVDYCTDDNTCNNRPS